MPLGEQSKRERIYSEEEILKEIEVAKEKAVQKPMASVSGTAAAKENIGRPPGRLSRQSYPLVVFTCLALGVICVGSSVFKTWFGTPSSYDWFVLGMGVILCGLSLFRKVSLGAAGFDAELRALQEQIRTLAGIKADRNGTDDC
jgi:hypothetical protein